MHRRSSVVAVARLVVGAALVTAPGGCVVDAMPSGPLVGNASDHDVELHVVGTDRVETIRADGGRYLDVDGCAPGGPGAGREPLPR